MLRLFTFAAFLPALVLGCECPGGYPTCKDDGWCYNGLSWDVSFSGNCGASGGGGVCASSYAGPAPPSPPPAFLSDVQPIATVCEIDYEWHGCSAKCTFGLRAETAALHVEFVLHIDVKSEIQGEASLNFGQVVVLGEDLGLEGQVLLNKVVTTGSVEDEFPIPGLTIQFYGITASISMLTRFTVDQVRNGFFLDKTMTAEFGYVFSIEAPLGLASYEIPLNDGNGKYEEPSVFTYSCLDTTAVAVTVAVLGMLLVGGGWCKWKKKSSTSDGTNGQTMELQASSGSTPEAKV